MIFQIHGDCSIECLLNLQSSPTQVAPHHYLMGADFTSTVQNYCFEFFDSFAQVKEFSIFSLLK